MEMLTFFILVNFLWVFCPCREICSVLWWLWECILLEHPFSLGSGAFAAPGFCNRCKNGNAKPQAQDFVSCSSPNPLELIIAKDILQREIISEKLPSVSLALKILSVGQILWLVPHSFRYQLLPQNFWDVEQLLGITEHTWMKPLLWMQQMFLGTPEVLLYWFQIFCQNLMTCQNANTGFSTSFSLLTAVHGKVCLDFIYFSSCVHDFYSFLLR